MWRSLILASSLFLIPIIVQAQGRGGAGFSAGGHAIAAAPHSVSVAHAAPTTGAAHFSGGARIAPRGGSSRVSPTSTSLRPIRRPSNFHASVPGLGADSFRTAAGRSNRNVRPNRPDRRDRFNRRRDRREFAAFFPFFDGGFFLPSSPLDAEDGSGEVGPEELADEDYPQGPPPDGRFRLQEQAQPPVASPDERPEAQRLSEEYVFVRRDGTVFFAVAYAWDSGTLRYVTTEGFRRSVGSEALDLDATQKFNEQRGLNFHSPA